MALLQGADSEIPQTSLVAGHEIWGVYIAGEVGHVYTAAELQELGRLGVKGVLPIVVPLQSKSEDGSWWWATDEGAAEIVLLVAKARAWGLQGGSPVCFDIEEGTAEAMIAVDPSLPGKVEARMAAAASAYGYEAWTYGGHAWHDAIKEPKAKRWLADWPLPSGGESPAPTELPAGFDGLQYAGNVNEGRIDLDIFAGGLKYLGLDGVPGVIGEPEQAPAAETGPDEQAPESANAATSPASIESEAEGAARDEAEKVADAVEGEVPPAAEADATELDKTVDAPVTPTHLAETRDLVAEILDLAKSHVEALTTHLAELDDLIAKESPK